MDLTIEFTMNHVVVENKETPAGSGRFVREGGGRLHSDTYVRINTDTPWDGILGLGGATPHGTLHDTSSLPFYADKYICRGYCQKGATGNL